jgi:hypothetical protein
MPRHSLAERNLRAEDSADDTVLALHPHNLDLFFFFGICIYNAQHVCNYKDAREALVRSG